MIGDTSYDMSMERATGVQTLGVSWGYQPKSGLSDADAIVDTVADLATTLATWMERLT
ncbi:HAD family hydrolase [Marivita sp. S0852]|uniref:HAD family hydrolase n=1 Tax=Marivita sp. S0852 TaxID=3373893 RepID=UPI003981CE57